MPDSTKRAQSLNPLSAVSKLEKFCSLSCINEYLAIDSGGNVCERIVFMQHGCIFPRVGAGMNRSARV